MVTKGIIKSIDLLGNTCTVHIPFFETAGNDPIIETATVSNTPGSYNGYKVGDAVYVAFEDGNMSTPVVIGKLYLGTEKEKADPRGVSNVEESTAAKKATLPADSKLSAEIDSNVPNTTVPYNSLSSIANGLNSLNTEVGQMDRDYGNRFKQVSSKITENGDVIRSELSQEATKIRAEVASVKTDLEDAIVDTKTALEVADGEITATVSSVREELNGKIQENSTKISANTKAIELEAAAREEAINGVTQDYKAGIKVEADKITAEVQAREEAIAGVTTEFQSAIEQTASEIRQEVTNENSNIRSELAQTAENMVAKVSGYTTDENGNQIPTAFGWNLQSDSWTVFNENKSILTADKDGLHVSGQVDAKSGHLGKFIIGTVHNRTDDQGNEIKDENENPIPESGLYTEDYIDCFKQTPGVDKKLDGETLSGESGVYIGTDGIKLGKNFSVDPEGSIKATAGEFYEIAATSCSLEQVESFKYIGTEGLDLGAVTIKSTVTSNSATQQDVTFKIQPGNPPLDEQGNITGYGGVIRSDTTSKAARYVAYISVKAVIVGGEQNGNEAILQTTYPVPHAIETIKYKYWDANNSNPKIKKEDNRTFTFQLNQKVTIPAGRSNVTITKVIWPELLDPDTASIDMLQWELVEAKFVPNINPETDAGIILLKEELTVITGVQEAAEFSSSIIPITNNSTNRPKAQTLGSIEARWDDAYCTTLDVTKIVNSDSKTNGGAVLIGGDLRLTRNDGGTGSYYDQTANTLFLYGTGSTGSDGQAKASRTALALPGFGGLNWGYPVISKVAEAGILWADVIDCTVNSWKQVKLPDYMPGSYAISVTPLLYNSLTYAPGTAGVAPAASYTALAYTTGGGYVHILVRALDGNSINASITIQCSIILTGWDTNEKIQGTYYT